MQTPAAENAPIGPPSPAVYDAADFEPFLEDLLCHRVAGLVPTNEDMLDELTAYFAALPFPSDKPHAWADPIQ